MRYLLWTICLAMLLVASELVSRPLLPVDETRYMSVAWEAHVRGDSLVSHLNSETYAHKPPLLAHQCRLVDDRIERVRGAISGPCGWDCVHFADGDDGSPTLAGIRCFHSLRTNDACINVAVDCLLPCHDV